MSRRVDAVIWDLDGTLVDSDLYIVCNYLHLYEMYRPGYYPHLSEILSFSGPSVWDTLAEQFPDVDSEERMREFVRFSLERETQYQTLFPGEIETLRAIASLGIKMGLVTNKRRASAVQTLEAAGILNLFGSLVTLDDVKDPKPAPEGVNICLGELGVTPDRVIVIGDTEYDIVTARNANATSGLVTWSIRGIPERRADVYFDSMDDIRRWIANEL